MNNDNIANRSQNEAKLSATRSNEFAPFSTKAERFDNLMTKDPSKKQPPGPSDYFLEGPISEFNKSVERHQIDTGEYNRQTTIDSNGLKKNDL